MKKTAMVIGLIVLAVSGVYAQVSVAGQTVRYKYVATITKETGVRSNNRNFSDWWSADSIMYITFTSNSCYESDDKGIAKGQRKGRLFKDSSDYGIGMMDEHYSGTYRYQREQNNLFTFMEEVTIEINSMTIVNPFPQRSQEKEKRYINFSKDYKVLNIDRGATVFVYNREDPKPPEAPKPQPPVQLWE
ncbi:MAG: hypothetical protein LBB98_13225 [Treponema sp.]|jgi:hypothetical protein|nr:hypothetical protein [Treponema sp.]